jgi:hypothetical protein
MKRTKKRKGRYSLPERVIHEIEELRKFEEIYRNKCFFTSKVDVVSRIFFDKDEYEWVKDGENNEWFVSSKYHRYYNLNSQKGIKAFNRLTQEEQEFYFQRCRQTIKKLYESRNSYSFLNFYESLENIYVIKEKEKAKEYYDKYIKPEIQEEINKLREYEKNISKHLKKIYSINYFPSLVNAYLFEINQSKDNIKYNLYTKTGINRFRKLSQDEKLVYISKVKKKIDHFYLSNKKYHKKRRKESHFDEIMDRTFSKKDSKTLQYYKTLGLEHNASKEQVKKTYSTLSKIYHPDNVDTGNIEKYKKLNTAFNFLMKNL